MNHNIARIAMVDNQIRPADVTNYALLGSFLTVPRENFVPAGFVELAYGELEFPMSPSRKMMNVRGFAKLVQALSLNKNDHVLLIGAGLGYEAAVISPLVKTIIAVENNNELAAGAHKNLQDFGATNVQIVSEDLSNGAQKHGPFDVILFCGAINEVPEKIIKQLSPSGRMIAIVESENVFSAVLTRNIEGHFSDEMLFNTSAPKLPGFEKKTEFNFTS